MIRIQDSNQTRTTHQNMIIPVYRMSNVTKRNAHHQVMARGGTVSVARQVLFLPRIHARRGPTQNSHVRAIRHALLRSAHDFIACLSLSAIISETATIDSVEFMQLALAARETDRADDDRLAPGAKAPAGQRQPEVVVDARRGHEFETYCFPPDTLSSFARLIRYARIAAASF